MILSSHLPQTRLTRRGRLTSTRHGTTTDTRRYGPRGNYTGGALNLGGTFSIPYAYNWDTARAVPQITDTTVATTTTSAVTGESLIRANNAFVAKVGSPEDSGQSMGYAASAVSNDSLTSAGVLYPIPE